MDTRLKQRMIGAIVLTALAIIILPMLLDGSAQDRSRVVARIPEPPAIQLKKLTVADIDHSMKQMEAASATRVPHLVPSVPQSPDATGTGATVTPAPPASDTGNGSKASTVPAASAGATDGAKSSTGKGDGLVLDKNDLPVGWCLQLAAFKNHENALRLRDNLRASHFRAYVIAAHSEQGEVYRVFVGPMLEKAKLAEIGKQIESRFDLKGQIVRYRIEDDTGQLGG